MLKKYSKYRVRITGFGWKFEIKTSEIRNRNVNHIILKFVFFFVCVTDLRNKNVVHYVEEAT
jgi:hypothetical protein